MRGSEVRRHWHSSLHSCSTNSGRSNPFWNACEWNPPSSKNNENERSQENASVRAEKKISINSSFYTRKLLKCARTFGKFSPRGPACRPPWWPQFLLRFSPWEGGILTYGPKVLSCADRLCPSRGRAPIHVSAVCQRARGEMGWCTWRRIHWIAT